MIIGIFLIGVVGSVVYTSLSNHPSTAPAAGRPPSAPGAPPSPHPVSAPVTSGASYVVIDKHYVDVGTKKDTDNWFYGTVRNDGNERGDCNLIAYFFDEDDRAIDANVVSIKPLAPGQLTTFRTQPKVENVASAGIAFTANCGHGKLWHNTPQ